MELRQNRKTKTIQDTGVDKSYQKYNAKRQRSSRYFKLVERDAAIVSNMIKLLTVVKSKKPRRTFTFLARKSPF